MAGKRLILPNGKFAIGSGGKALITNAEGKCPECCGGEPSISCDDIPGSSIDVTFTGVQSCLCVYNSLKMVSGRSNGTFNLGFVSSASGGIHTYRLDDAWEVIYDVYPIGSGCVGTPTSTGLAENNMDLIVQVHKGLGGCHIRFIDIHGFFFNDPSHTTPLDATVASTQAMECNIGRWFYGGEASITATYP